MRWLVFLLILLGELTPKFLQAQQKTSDDIYSSEFSAGFLIHPRGIGINVRTGKRIMDRTWRIFELDIMSMKHPKEFKIRSTAFQQTPGAYVFGKLNSLYLVNTGIGIKKELSGKLYKNTISTTIQFSGGPAFGLLKPVYLDIYYPYPDNTSGYLVSERYNPEIHTQQDVIHGASKFTRGLGESKVKVGLYGRVSAHFDWSDFNDQLQSVELGIMANVFPERLPVMAFVQNKYLYSSVYICVNFGNRW